MKTETTTREGDAFDKAVTSAIEKLGVIAEYKKPGQYDAIAFDEDDLVLVSARAPLKPGQAIKPRGITVRRAVEWAADRGGNAPNEAKLFRFIAKHLEAYGAP